MNIVPMTPSAWEDYELIDSGDGQKLERFGEWIIARPEPQALWKPTLTDWNRRANATFIKNPKSDEKGEWRLDNRMPQQWVVQYRNLRLRLGLTSFKHVGIFPEQAANWDFISETIEKISDKIENIPSVLNLFAYTGGATLAAAAAGADVTHVDSVKQVVSWSRENLELTSPGNNKVRWIVDDALKFVQREVRRGKKYHGIILDPPSYGRGPDGEKWVLEENIYEMLECCSKLLEENNSFIILNLYSMGLSAMLARTIMRQLFAEPTSEQMGELYAEDSFGKQLPLGIFYRMVR